MNIRQGASFFATAVGIAALLLAIIGGSLLLAMEGLASIITFGNGTPLIRYPLGAGILAVYACGIVLGVAAFRWPAAAGMALLPVGACAFLFGGPIAQVYGIVIACTALVILAVRPRHA